MITEERLRELIEQKATIYFAVQDVYEFAEFPNFVFSSTTDPARLIIVDRNKRKVVFDKPKTEENYIEVYRLAKKLFLEGSNE